ncbi:MAG TPA: hypothetical protein VLW85_16160 [Myxococcales bacterium]|nr:hypothetical protein [Myxococcales bacterium]
MTDFQKTIEEAFSKAQTRAAARAKEFEAEARKVLETLGDRAQAELKVLLQQAQTVSRDQLLVLGVELEKLGKKLQELAKQNKAPEAAHAAAENVTQAAPENVQ